MNRSSAVIVILALVAGGSTLLTTGCSSSGGPDRTVNTTAQMDQFKQLAARLAGQIDATLASLSDISTKASADPRPAYQNYARQVDQIDSMAQDVLDQADAARASGEAYFVEWEKEAATIQNPEIRKKSEDRRSKVFEVYKKIEGFAAQSREALNPFLSDLKDIRTLLANDLTPAGIADSKDLVGKVTGAGAKVKERMDALSKEVERLAAQLRISTPAPQ